MGVATERGSDRRVRYALRFPERRTGFDRRAPESSRRRRYLANLRSYRDRPLTFPLVLATIVVFNFLDYMLTLRVLRMGGTELNPIMAHLFESSPVLAAAAKLGSVGLVVIAMMLLRRYRRTLELSLFLLLGFTALTFYHAAIAIRLLG